MAKIIKNALANFLAICLIFLMVAVWIFSGWPQIWKKPPIPPEIPEARADTTEEVYPTLGESVKESPWSDNSWNTPTNIYADDGATANVTAANFDNGDQTAVLKATGFDFSAILDGSTINGVIVRVNSWYRSGQGSGSMDLLQLLDTSKAKVGTNQCATPVVLTEDDTTIITKGTSEDLWGNALDAAWVKNANFGVAIGILATANNADVDVDYVTIEIYYTPPANVPPTGSINSAAQKTDGSGAVDISIEVDDPNDDDTKAKIEYVANGTCDFATPLDPTLDEAGGATADFNDSGGAPSVVNADTYQVGTTADYRIITSSGSNTVQFDWNSATDAPSGNGTYCLRLTVNDDTVDQTTPVTQTLTIDNVAPTAPGNLTDGGKTTSSITLTFGSQTTETNFSTYRIYYKQGTTGVTESDTEHSDADLGFIDYNSTTNTTVSGLTANTDYVFNIWAYDTYGHKANATELSIKTAALTLTFTIDGDLSIGFGTLVSANARFATDTTGSDTATSAHTMTVATNASSGYTVTYNGATLTASGGTIDVATITGDEDGTPGTEQFAIGFTTDGDATITSAYAKASNNYSFVASTTTAIITESGPTATETFSAYYLANISSLTEAGSYSTSVTYIATGNF